MKLKFAYLYLILLSSFSLTAQDKFDYQWVVGNPPDGGDSSLFGAYIMDFNNGDVKFIKAKKASMSTYRSIASICNKEGKLVLYSNGCQLQNGDFEVVEGCENVNPGNAWDEYCSNPTITSYPSIHSQILLPMPEKENQYFYFAHRIDFSEKYTWDKTHYNSEFMHYVEVDMNLLGGKGKATKSASLEYPDEIKGFNLAACKHANGKDWWIINFSFNKQKFYRTLLTKDGISGPWEQSEGPPRDSEEEVGQSVFSPDGKKFACVYSNTGKVWVMDFDRTTGLMSNKIILTYNTNFDWYYRGVTFSPNSKYLYVSAGYYLYQYDITANDIQSSEILIAENDGYFLPEWPYFINFNFGQLGPDGKIYIGQYAGSVRHWSVINEPDKPGLACNFQQHSLLFPSYSIASTPIQPHFRLGADTSATEIKREPKFSPDMKVWFNSSSSIVKCWIQHLNSDKEKYSISIIDVTGRELLRQTIPKSHYQEDVDIDVSNLSIGTYLVSLYNSGQLLNTQKIIIY